MIVKVKSPNSLLRVLTYNLHKVEQGVGAVLYTQGVYNPSETALTAQSLHEDMMVQIPSKTRTKKVAFSASLNPDPTADKLSDEQLVEIAKEFMQKMGYGDQPFVVVKHWDIPRPHIHIIATRVDKLGRKISDKHEGRKARKVVDALERKYNLKLTHPDKNTKKTSKTLEEPKLINLQEGNVKEQVYKVASYVMERGAFQSIGGFNALLARYGLSAKFTKNEHKGRKYDGIVYIPIDDKGKPLTNPIPSKDLGRGVGYTAVKTKMAKSASICRLKAEEMREQIAETMMTRPKSLQALQNRLFKDHGIEMVVKQNAQGRIYGVTFVNQELVAVSGSKLGQEFSANTFQLLYGTQPESKQTTSSEESESWTQGYSGRWHTSASAGEDWKEINWQKYLRRKYSTKIKR